MSAQAADGPQIAPQNRSAGEPVRAWGISALHAPRQARGFAKRGEAPRGVAGDVAEPDISMGKLRKLLFKNSPDPPTAENPLPYIFMEKETSKPVTLKQSIKVFFNLFTELPCKKFY